ncbi:MAG TPA: hypothetical protein VM925_03705 [Labilithrix sp.]|nr:hypothetical protein [Labilithrix sp.]
MAGQGEDVLCEGDLASATAPPRQVAGLPPAVDLALGSHHGCALAARGTVWCWGANGYGQFGDGSTLTLRTQAQPVPSVSTAKQLVGGADHVCALLEDRTVRCWGRNNRGQLGDGTTVHRSTPVSPLGLSDVAKLVAGYDSTCAFLAAGVKCWGANDFQQLGQWGKTESSVPLDAVLDFTAFDTSIGRGHACQVIGDGSIHCRGDHTKGQLGDAKASEVGGNSASARPAELALGGSHTCALVHGLKANPPGGFVHCWGDNSYGQLGDGTVVDSPSPKWVVADEVAVQLSVGLNHSCYVDKNHDVWCWGFNFYGQAGRGYTPGAPQYYQVTHRQKVSGLK